MRVGATTKIQLLKVALLQHRLLHYAPNTLLLEVQVRHYKESCAIPRPAFQIGHRVFALIQEA